MVAIFSVAITLSGTKGAILCLLFSGVLVFLYVCFVAKKRYILPISIVLAILCFSIFLFPNYNFENRVIGFLKEHFTFQSSDDASDSLNQSGGDNSSAQPSPDTNTSEGNTNSLTETFDYDSMGRITDVLEQVANGTARQMYESGELSEDQYQAMLEFSRTWNGSFSGARIILWKNVWKEVKNAPIFGQGPYFFWHAYGTYPHNFLMELATDFGVIIAVCILALGVYIFGYFIYLIKKARGSRIYTIFCLYTMSFLPRMMISDSIYSSTFFYMAGMAIVLFCFRRHILLEDADLKEKDADNCAEKCC